jgi:hypothetical protein
VLPQQPLKGLKTMSDVRLDSREGYSADEIEVYEAIANLNAALGGIPSEDSEVSEDSDDNDDHGIACFDAA